MAEKSRTPEEKLLYAQQQAVVYCPPLGALLMKLRFRESPDQKETLRALSNGALLYNPMNVDAISENQLVSHMTEAVFHTALREGMRNQMYNEAKFRVALQSKIIQILDEAGLPEIFGTAELRKAEWDMLAPEEVLDQIADLTPEEAVELCPCKLPLTVGRDDDDPEDDDDADGGMGDTRPPILTAALGEMLAMAKDIGDEMLGLQLLIGDIYEPQIDWRQRLRHSMQQILGPWGRSFQRPHRRGHGIAQAIGMPGYVMPGPDRGFESVILCVDLSGSVVGDKGLVEDFCGEMNGIMKLCQRPCRVILHEVAVIDDFECKNLNDLIPKLKGGGGTDFVPTYERLCETHEKIPLVVWLTDLYGGHVPEPPPFPMIWVCGSNHDSAPWGQIIEIPTQNTEDRDAYEY